MNKIIWVIVAVVIILLGVLIFNRPTQAPPPVVPPAASTTIESSGAADASSFRTLPETVIRPFTITGSNFKFSPAEIKVKQGEIVKITFQNESGSHNWQLDEFKVATKILKAGEAEIVEFAADKKGVFEYYCVVGEHRQMGMKGKLIVE
ncbi:MAG: cupredoxin domain-containing protein [Patescibacteria group bacterium]